MNILGLDALVFGVDDIQSCADFLQDYGLNAVQLSESGGRFEALDGTAVVIRHSDDPSLPAGHHGPSPSLRETVYGVRSINDLDAIEDDLGRDREVSRDVNGVLHSVDDLGFAIAFQVTCRRPFEAPADLTNSPGSAPQRPVNQLGITADMPAVPRSLSHVVYFVPDAVKGEAFYRDRLGFVTTDSFIGAGPFMRTAGMDDHHCLFLIQTPPHMQGCEHFTFHVGSGTEVMVAGTRLQQKGWTSFWGPGRHLLGSNWFWYFNSPLGCHVEYDADMDQHDDEWVARQSPMSADNSQLFLFTSQEKWMPGGPPPKKG
ncbi:VOC family protein [Pseudomonas sp. FP597]|uniref:VOC family protein n=1 Tax=Pseudomonas sp. FP597 TaxID=2954096 RepID=UPI002734A9C3|nr:VOC family protein [Pseudomonas sp. FP597]WLI04533.1 VOC family protein [Pseudomonas sp. FP597]